MRVRDEASAPNVGDRVAYVMIQAAKGSKGYEKSEDPLWVLQNNLPIDCQWYMTNQLQKPLIRIFEPMYDTERSAYSDLFVGDHMRNIFIPAMSSTKMGLFKFTQVQRTCLGCKNLLNKN